MSLPRFYGRAGLAKYLGVSVTRIGQLNIPADARVDERPVWTPATATRLRIELEQSRAARQARRTKGDGRARAQEALA